MERVKRKKIPISRRIIASLLAVFMAVTAIITGMSPVTAKAEPDTKVTESVECAEPFVRHPRERDYRMLGRLKSDCEYFLKFGAGNENVLYYKNVEEHCNAMEKLWNSFEDNDKPEWLTMEQIQEYRYKMTRKLKENGLTTSVNNLSEALSETNRMLARTDNTVKNVTDSVTFDEEEQKEILPR